MAPLEIFLDCSRAIIYICRAFEQGPVAQLVEQRPFKPLVPGSNPGGLTLKGNLNGCLSLLFGPQNEPAITPRSLAQHLVYRSTTRNPRVQTDVFFPHYLPPIRE